MVALLRQGAWRIGGSPLQRTKAAAVAEEARRMYITEKGAGKWWAKWEERQLAFRRFDSDFTKVLKTVAGIYCIYGILAVGDDPPWPIRKYVPPEYEEEAQTDKKNLEK